MGAVVYAGTSLRAEPLRQVLRDSRAHCGHGTRYMAAEFDGEDEATCSAGGRNRHFQDRHHRRLPAYTGPGDARESRPPFGMSSQL